MSITVRHGESGTLFYVVRLTGDNEEDWEVVATFHSRKEAEEFIAGSV